MKELEEKLYEIFKNYKSEFISFYDKNQSLISKSNNQSFHKEKRDILQKELIYKSSKLKALDNESVNYFIHSLLEEFDLLIKPNSKS